MFDDLKWEITEKEAESLYHYTAPEKELAGLYHCFPEAPFSFTINTKMQ